MLCPSETLAPPLLFLPLLLHPLHTNLPILLSILEPCATAGKSVILKILWGNAKATVALVAKNPAAPDA